MRRAKSKICIACGLLLLAGLCSAQPRKPNILFVLVDDMGFSDLGCYGGEIHTPTLDALAGEGIRFTQFYNTAKCFTTRACLLTGVYPQQCGMDKKPGAIAGAVTLGEVLRPAGYRTLASGKHHGTENLYDRGFDHYYGLRDGACNFWNPGAQREGEPPPGSKGKKRAWCDDETTTLGYTPEDRNFYTTDAFTNKALQWLDEDETREKPFFLYLAYNAPHYPLHAWPEDMAKYRGVYDEGYASIQQARLRRLKEMGLLTGAVSALANPSFEQWKTLSGEAKAKEVLRMQIYAAMLDRVDQNLARVIAKLKAQGRYENTLILFASDNGGCAENSGAKVHATRLEDFGKLASYETVGKNWATVQNTPFKFWKNYSHEGGICTPFIVSWPGKIRNPGRLDAQPAHVIDIMPTLVEITGAAYPDTFRGGPVVPMQGTSLVPAFSGVNLERRHPLFWQWSRGGAIRKGHYKAVFWGGQDTWELYDIGRDRNEAADLAARNPELLQGMVKEWKAWVTRVSTE